jgi:hypothetical protein
VDLINQIIDTLSSETPNLESALLKTKVLLHRLGDTSSIEWINKEINGYLPEDAVPNYRKLNSVPYVNATNGVNRWAGMTPTTMHLTKEQKSYFFEDELRESISGIEFLSNGDSSSLSHPIPPEYWHFLSQGLMQGVEIENAYCEIVKSQILQVGTVIRSRLLDFVLALEDKIPSSLESENMKEVSRKIGADKLFNNAMFGSNATIIIGNNNSQTINNSVIQNDLDSLKQFFSEKGIKEADLNNLEVAIANDEHSPSHVDKQYGPNVQSWIKAMMSKAVDTAWQVELGIASSLLATALNNFYGFI